MAAEVRIFPTWLIAFALLVLWSPFVGGSVAAADGHGDDEHHHRRLTHPNGAHAASSGNSATTSDKPFDFSATATPWGNPPGTEAPLPPGFGVAQTAQPQVSDKPFENTQHPQVSV